MNKTKITLCFTLLAFFLSLPVSSFAADLKSSEKILLNEFRSAIPKDKFKTVDDLSQKWQEVQSGKSKVIILDIRTEAEFESGHLIGSNNIDSGHAYGLTKKIKDPNTEIWVIAPTPIFKLRADEF